MYGQWLIAFAACSGIFLCISLIGVFLIHFVGVIPLSRFERSDIERQ